MSRITEVRAWPCDPASDDYKNGPVIVNNAGGFTEQRTGGKRVQPSTVLIENLSWRVARDDNSGILWVLCPARETVEAYRPAFERYIGRELNTGKAMPKPTNKRMALNAVTQAVTDALGHGATAVDIRLAVFSAMGLDSDAA